MQLKQAELGAALKHMTLLFNFVHPLLFRLKKYDFPLLYNFLLTPPVKL